MEEEYAGLGAFCKKVVTNGRLSNVLIGRKNFFQMRNLPM
jgi:hypothetical protein